MADQKKKKNHEYASRRPGHDRLPAFRTRLPGPRIVEVILYGELHDHSPAPAPADAVVRSNLQLLQLTCRGSI